MLSHPDYIDKVKAPAGIAPDDGWADLEKTMEESYKAEAKRRREKAAAEWEQTAKNPLLYASAVNRKQKAEREEPDSFQLKNPSNIIMTPMENPKYKPKKIGWISTAKFVCALAMMFGGAILGYAGFNSGFSLGIVLGGVALGMSIGREE